MPPIINVVMSFGEGCVRGKKGNPVTTRKKEGYYHNRAATTAKPARARTGRLAWRLVVALLLLRRPALAAPRGAMLLLKREVSLARLVKGTHDGLGEGEASDPEDDPVEGRQELSPLEPMVI